jgi:Ca2+-binding RTX toxin-like protein
MLFSTYQASWSAVIICPNDSGCQGTPDDDLLWGTTSNAFYDGREGNDIIRGFQDGPNYIVGGLGPGNDKYDAGGGHDSIFEDIQLPEHIEGGGNDDISGNIGNDWISSGNGADRIFGGPGDDYINDNWDYRDFSEDIIDCGSGTDFVGRFNSGDGDTAVFCESINNEDG